MDWTQLKPAKVNITAFQGVTFRRRYLLRMADGSPFPFKNEAGEITWKAESEIRPEAESSDLLARMSTADEGIVIGADDEESWYTLQLSDVVMDTLPGGRHTYDVTLITPEGESVPIQGGSFEVKARATKRVLDVG